MATINSLEYDEIKTSIVEFLKQDPYFKKFNFEASNISRLINILAYSSMYNGYYMKMLLDESMPDSAKTRTSLIGHANTRNYLTKFISAARANINVSIDAATIDTDTTPYIQLLRGQNFKGVDKNGSTIYFMLPYDVTLLYNETTDKYEGDDFIVIQGQYKTFSYVVTELNKKYQINDTQCDDTSISVKLKSNKNSTISYEYLRNDDFYETGQTDLKYYITSSTNGVYQIHFGRDIFGREPKIGEFIEIGYIKTNGSDANDTNKFDIVLSKTSSTQTTDINYYELPLITCKTIESSSGGLGQDSIEELRFSTLNYSRQRGRVVTPEDIKTVIIAEFRDVESINVWSGGESKHRRYGKTYISIKPKTSELLTQSAKTNIADLLVNRFGVISKTDLIFVNPNFTDILLTIKYKINRAITTDNSSTVKARVESNTNIFNKSILSKFDVNYYDSDFIKYIRDNDVSILSLFTEKKLQKTLTLNYSSGKFDLDFGNQLKGVESNIFVYGNLNVFFKNTLDGMINLYNSVDMKIISTVGNIDFEKGLVSIIIPTYVSVRSINIIADPLYPDVSTVEDNIVRIKTINAIELP